MTKQKTKELVVAEQSAPATLISQALTKGADLDKLAGLLDLQIKWEKNEARKAYVVAMAAFKADPPEINKDQEVDFKNKAGIRTNYKHASLANVTGKINRALSQHDLSAAWSTAQDAAGIAVTCSITHIMGHSESTTLTAGPDCSGGKNAIQAIASTVSYLERYTILALTGLATHDDDDGQTSGQNRPRHDVKKEPGRNPSKTEFNEKKLEVDSCTNKERLDKWIGDNKPWIDGLSDEYRGFLKEHCQQYYDMFKTQDGEK